MNIARHYYNPTPEQKAELAANMHRIAREIRAKAKRRDTPLKLVSIRSDIERFVDTSRVARVSLAFDAARARHCAGAPIEC